MARYFLRFRHSDTGLTPVFTGGTFFKKASDLSLVSPPPIGEVGNGTYYFDYTPTFDIVFEVDGGASIPTEEVRYIADTISPKDTYVDEPTSQVRTDVWTDTTVYAAGQKGKRVDDIGAAANTSADATLFGKTLLYKESVRGDTAGTSDGNDVEQVYDAVVAAQADLTDIKGAGFATGTDSLKVLSDNLDTVTIDVGNVATDVNTANAALTDIKGAGFATGTDSLKVLSDNLDTVSTNVTTANTALTDIQGAGFATGADSLKVLSDGVDDIKGAGFVSGNDSLKVISDNVDAINVETDPTAIANAVWNELITGHQTADSMGRMLNDVFRLLKNKSIINPTTKQLEVYNDAGVAIVFTFDLKDDVGVASATKIFQRLPL